MKNTDSPLWKQMFSPTSSKSELTEIRHRLSIDENLSYLLQAFLYSEWLAYHTKVRTELNPELRQEYLHYAHALAEIAGKLFKESESPKTTEMPSSI
ncbi:hypothetical protein [Avibacterium avium]|uniref:hypothetical protein n=1 Tax=Avibacterium avium TaxID=751 RepID=UPI003BF8409A